MYSVAKSFVVTLAGILVREGKLSLDAPPTTALDRPRGIADATWARAGLVRVRHVFGILSGYEYIHTPTHHPLYTAMDRRVIALLPGTEATPGTRFKYSDADAVLAAATVAKAAGRDLLAFARDALFKPLAFREVEWWYRDHAGLYHAGGGLRVRPMDAAKLAVFVGRGNKVEDVDLTKHPTYDHKKKNTTTYPLTKVTHDQVITRLEFRRTDDYPLAL